MNHQNQQTVELLKAQRTIIAQAVVDRQYELEPDVWNRYGPEGYQKSIRDADYHFSYLFESVLAEDPSLFVDYILWVKELFAGLNLPVAVIETTLKIMQDVLAEFLPVDLQSVLQPYFAGAVSRLMAADAETAAVLGHQPFINELAQQYLDVLLRGERAAASRLILDAVEQGVSVKEIYLHVFQPVQYKIGRLWQTNRITVAEEHYFTAATQLIMSQLYPYIFSTVNSGRRLVATCVGGELHEIGIRMVADFFEMAGWDTYYLGANTPDRSLLQTVEDKKPDILALSTTMTFNVSAVADLIRLVRQSETIAAMKIIVGGYPFNLSAGLWQKVGANGCAKDAQQAIVLAEELVENET